MSKVRLMFNQIRDPLGMSLHRNSAALIVDQVLIGGFGFIFWIVAAHYGPPSMIGKANAAIGVINLLGILATLGLPLTIVRFWSRETDPVGFYVTSVIVVAVSGLAVGGAWLALGSWGLPRAFSFGARCVLAAAVAASAIGVLTTSGLIARRRARLVVVKDAIGIVVRFAVLGALIGSAWGLVAATIISGFVATIAGGFLVGRHSTYRGAKRQWVTLAYRVVRRARFALTTHAAAVAATVPLYLLPAIFVERLGSTNAAFVSIPLLVAYMLNAIPQATSNAMLAEISHDEVNATRYVRKSLGAIYLLAAPAVLVMVLISSFVLRFFGSSYAAHGTTCLQLMAVSVLFSCANYVGDALLLARQRIFTYLVVNVLGTLAVFGWILLLGSSPTGSGEGWLAGQVSYLLISLVGLTLGRNHRSTVRHGEEVDAD
jgi:O-antigen/teichoic acid export membrane protein